MEIEKVVYRVYKDIQRRASADDKASPPPLIITPIG
jgi:hypothetical protein